MMERVISAAATMYGYATSVEAATVSTYGLTAAISALQTLTIVGLIITLVAGFVWLAQNIDVVKDKLSDLLEWLGMTEQGADGLADSLMFLSPTLLALSELMTFFENPEKTMLGWARWIQRTFGWLRDLIVEINRRVKQFRNIAPTTGGGGTGSSGGGGGGGIVGDIFAGAGAIGSGALGTVLGGPTTGMIASDTGRSLGRSVGMATNRALVGIGGTGGGGSPNVQNNVSVNVQTGGDNVTSRDAHMIGRVASRYFSREMERQSGR